MNEENNERVEERNFAESLQEALKEDKVYEKELKRQNDRESQKHQRSSSVVPSNTNTALMTTDKFLDLGLVIAGPTTGKTWLVNKLRSEGHKVMDGDDLMKEADPRWTNYETRVGMTQEEVESFSAEYDNKVLSAIAEGYLVITSRRPKQQSLMANPLKFPDCMFPLIVQRNDPSVVEAIMRGERNTRSFPVGETERWHAHNIADSNSNLAKNYIWIAKGENLSSLITDLEV